MAVNYVRNGKYIFCLLPVVKIRSLSYRSSQQSTLRPGQQSANEETALDAITRVRQRGFGNRVGFGRKAALLVVDFARNFTSPDTALGGEMAEPLRQANRLIAAARAAGMPVFFSTIAYADPKHGTGVWGMKIKGLVDLQLGSSEVDQDPRLEVAPGDAILVKRGASCFFGTSLDADLRKAGVDTLVVAGCSTSGCVRASVVDACQLDYRPIIAAEATADRLDAAHEQALVDMDLKYGDVMSVDEIVDHLSKNRPSA
jgi:maleamate amidohydrolase